MRKELLKIKKAELSKWRELYFCKDSTFAQNTWTYFKKFFTFFLMGWGVRERKGWDNNFYLTFSK